MDVRSSWASRRPSDTCARQPAASKAQPAPSGKGKGTTANWQKMRSAATRCARSASAAASAGPFLSAATAPRGAQLGMGHPPVPRPVGVARQSAQKAWWQGNSNGSASQHERSLQALASKITTNCVQSSAPRRTSAQMGHSSVSGGCAGAAQEATRGRMMARDACWAAPAKQTPWPARGACSPRSSRAAAPRPPPPRPAVPRAVSARHNSKRNSR